MLPSQVLWQSLKSGGIYVVEDISENYIEKPFLAAGTFTEFVKNAIDVVQCRHAHAHLTSFPFGVTWPRPEDTCIHHMCAFIPKSATTPACRMKPSYMGPDSPVKKEFMEFCASNPMDSESLAFLR